MNLFYWAIDNQWPLNVMRISSVLFLFSLDFNNWRHNQTKNSRRKIVFMMIY